ncbi:MAG TPA: DUF3450 family protein, partial [Gammaproteobacteria bacterium]|nr:DUF3450 family protein [Gammaproteobacteria bacterium]
IMEVYQIEIDYGRSMKAYRGKLADGRDADFVYLGRVSLMYQTVDGKESGYWDAKNAKWVVDPRYQRFINDALKIAKEETAADLTTLPVPAAAETHS